ncbi:MAG: hypothetical protein NVS4B12_28540 [Ktedonobacteraceae bacterium]
MFVPTTSRPRMTEKPEGRSMSYVPMVYEKFEPTPTRWEYHVLTVDTREQELPDAIQLNELGSKGWILVNVVNLSTNTFVYFYFVRQIEE